MREGPHWQHWPPDDPPTGHEGYRWCSECGSWECECVDDPEGDASNEALDPIDEQNERECDLPLDKVEATTQYLDELSARGNNAGGGDVCDPAPPPAPLCEICGAKMVKQSNTYTYCPREGLFSHRAKPKKFKPLLQLDYPVWRMSFSEYGNAMGWEVPA